MAQQTAVEWLIQQMQKGEVAYGMFHVPSQTEVFEQAKQMEKEQIVVSFYEGMKTNTFDPNMGRGVLYYNEIYGK